ncbi:MAG: murein L,D-transpeptidase family protein [Hyphomicrobiaceae bacterium]|nr:murein L,D-transpeptidase [Hyphomicrobiaceae bacterium]
MLLQRSPIRGDRTALRWLVGGIVAVVALWAPLSVNAATTAGASVTTAASNIPKHLKSLPQSTLALHASYGVGIHDPVYIRVFKEESELEVWRGRADGSYVHVRTYPICTFSGELGPKTRYADYQAPEGFYSVTARQMKPDSGYHLAFNVGYPNALDRALGRTGDLIMVHGKCKSVGCFAMTDGPMEEIYAIARDALRGGQAAIPVHSFPFRMTDANIARHAGHRHAATWAPLIDAYRDFQVMRAPPRVAICDKRYVVNPVWETAAPTTLGATQACPAHGRVVMPGVEHGAEDEARRAEVILQSPKQRTAENIAPWAHTRARHSVALLEQRRQRRERFRSIMAARDQLDPTYRMNLGMGRRPD